MARKPNRKGSYKQKDGNSFKSDEFQTKQKRTNYKGKARDDGPRNVYGSNDWRWYATSEQLLRDTASHPYTYPLGNTIDFNIYGGTKTDPISLNANALPGIMKITLIPTFGYSEDQNSAINIASRNIYSFVRHANSGHSNYDSPDLMIYLMAMDNIYSFIEWCKRIYGTSLTWSPENRYLQQAIVYAMNVDYTDIQANLSDFRAFINTMVAKAGSMCIPASMSYMAKHMWMYREVFCDSVTSKAQMYLFNPEEFYKFSLDEDGAGCLVSNGSIDNTPNPYTFADIVAYGNALLNAVISDEDMNIMSGDILKAYTPGGVFKLETIPENYVKLPFYDDRALDQIQNCSLLGYPYTGWKYRLLQDTNKEFLISIPAFEHPYALEAHDVNGIPMGSNPWFYNRLITFDKMDVSAADTMEATRLANICKYHPDDEDILVCTTPGSEVACRAAIYHYQRNGADLNLVRTLVVQGLTLFHKIPTASSIDRSSWPDEWNLLVGQVNAQNATDNIKSINELALIGMFNRHPTVYINTAQVDVGYVADIGDTTTFVPTGTATAHDPMSAFTPIGDMNNYTIIEEQDLRQMSDVALISEFSITQYGAKTEMG